MSGKTLTGKRKLFVEEYLKCWNATEAARRAGYKHPNVYAATLVKLSAVQDAISKRLQEKAMGADEVLYRLGEIARSEHTKYLSSGGFVNLGKMIEDDKIHLVKGIKETRQGKEILFYDGQKALVDIGRHHGLFKDRTENLNIDLSNLTNDQLKRIANGESPLDVLADPGKSGT